MMISVITIGKPSSDHLECDWAPNLKLGYDLDCIDIVKTRERHERLKARCERRHELNDANRMEVVMEHETSSSINDTCTSISIGQLLRSDSLLKDLFIFIFLEDEGEHNDACISACQTCCNTGNKLKLN